jgi:hypothetical protein
MKRTLIIGAAIGCTAATMLASPAGAQSHTKGALCPTAASECDRKTNTLWLCAPVPNENKKPGDATIYAWKTNGVCTNNLAPGVDMDKNAEKEKENAAKRRAATEKVIADENKAKADEKKKADDKKAADKKASDAKAAKDKADKEKKK